jgi:hypothetical protein
MAKKEQAIELKEIKVNTAIITIEGDGDLVLNKMNEPTIRALTDQRKDKAKSTEKPNEWECIITAMHWRDGYPKEFTEEALIDALQNNAPCITSFGLKKAILAAVVRNGIDTYSTKMDSALNIVATGGLIPIKFADHFIDEKLMSPKRGAPVLVHLNRFSGWSATFTIKYTENVYGIEQIVNVINLAGFGSGIGSGRTSGYGRFHVSNVVA